MSALLKYKYFFAGNICDKLLWSKIVMGCQGYLYFLNIISEHLLLAMLELKKKKRFCSRGGFHNVMFEGKYFQLSG